eukprot:TRINITY_DN4019_c0_g1_i1.p1 TRINITY_DN4019_c0_g1~~TRINITY_DN4019_c0_g1_i1.p1  ORF type:complete len:463 (+),score=86.64 TRINITY_DN4019_c0_g1_i1:627-2015(+)
MPPTRRRRRHLWRSAVTAVAAAAAAAAGIGAAADDCPALLNLTSFFSRTLLLVGPRDNAASVNLQNIRFSSSSTPIRVSSGFEVRLKVRVDASCNATAGHPASRTALAAAILVRRRDGSTLAIRTHRSWQWVSGDVLVDSTEWEGAPLNDAAAPAGAAWLTNAPSRSAPGTFWTTVMTNLPAYVCKDVDPAVVGVVGSAGGGEARRGWRTAPLATSAVLGGLLLLMSGVAAAMQMVLHRLRRLDGDVEGDADGPDKVGKREPVNVLADSLRNNFKTPPGTLPGSTSAGSHQRPQAAGQDMPSALNSIGPRADAADAAWCPPSLMIPRGQRVPRMAPSPPEPPPPPPTVSTGPPHMPSITGISSTISSAETWSVREEQGNEEDDFKKLSDLAMELATGFQAPPSMPAALLSPQPPPLPAALFSPGPPPLPAVLFSPAPPPLPTALCSPEPPSGPAERRHTPSA